MNGIERSGPIVILCNFSEFACKYWE